MAELNEVLLVPPECEKCKMREFNDDLCIIFASPCYRKEVRKYKFKKFWKNLKFRLTPKFYFTKYDD